MNQKRRVAYEFVDVVPLVYLPRGVAQGYTYRLPTSLRDKIRPYQLVVAPFRRRLVRAVVTKIHNQPKSDLKKIFDIKSALPYPPLTNGQLEIIAELENYYGASRTLAYKTVVPELVVKPLVKKRGIPHENTAALGLTKINRRTLRQLLGAKGKLTISGALYDPRHPVFLEYVRRNIKNGGQVLMLFTNNETALITKEYYEKYFAKSNLILWSSRATASQLSSDWLGIISGKVSIVLATRSGPFLPFKSLKAIVLFDEADNSYKSWDQQPYYDTRHLAERLAALKRISLLTTRLLPPFLTQSKILSRTPTGARAKLIVLDRRIFHEQNSQAVIPEPALEAISQSSVATQCLVFVNRLGYAALLCNDCHYAFRCANCHAHLIYFGSAAGPAKGMMKCVQCGQLANISNCCPQCQGVKLRYWGMGIERIEEALKQRFPNKIIQRLDRQSIKKNHIFSALLDNIRFNRAEITVTTSIILPRLAVLPRFNTVVVMQAESLFLQPHWRANEDGLGAIHQLWAAAKQYCFLETGLAAHPVIEAVKLAQEKELVKRELNERKRFHYPPYARLLELSSINEKAVLPPAIEQDKKLTIVNPDQGKGKKNILIKAPLNYKFNLLWPHLDAGWKADVDPIAII